ncbi:hypothetical protein [Bacillus massilioanorexius]|nr:hypothetical protein [Bacillus massilioanorexius]
MNFILTQTRMKLFLNKGRSHLRWKKFLKVMMATMKGKNMSGVNM